MVKSTDLVVWLSEVDKSDVAFVGGKGANLGEMIQAKFPVPNGFVLTAYSYFLFLKQNSLETKIKHLLGTVNYDDPVSIDQVSRHIKKILLHSEVPVEVVKKVFEYYKKIGRASCRERV